MNRDAQYLRHWAAMARLTEEQSSLLGADTLEALAGKFEALEANNETLSRAADNMDAERKLLRAELERLKAQEPVAKVDACNCTWFVTSGVDMKPTVGSLLYAEPRPAPAQVVNVPDAITGGWPNDPLYVNGWNACRTEVLRLNDNSAPATDNTEAQYESLKRGKTL